MTGSEVRERPVPAGPGGSSAPWRRIHVGEFGWIWFGLVAVFVFSAIVAPGTLHLAVFAAMLPFAAVLTIAAVGETLVIQQRGLDLSLPGTMSMCALVMTRTEASHGVIPGLLLTLAVAIAIGAVNGWVITRLSITPLVATLAVNSLVVGAVFSYAHGLPIAASPGLSRFTRAKVLGVPSVVLVAIAVIVVLAVISHRSIVGRRFTMTGASASASRAAGVRIAGYQLGAYVTAAICAGLAGVLLAGFTGSATADLGTPYLLTAIAAVVVGGTPFTGGRGSLVATAVAALFLSQLNQVTLALGAPTSIQLFVQAGALVLATALRYIRGTGLFRRRARLIPAPAGVAV